LSLYASGLSDALTKLSRGTARKALRTECEVTSVVRIWLSTIVLRCAVKSIVNPSFGHGK
jgi:hypothetical protein